MQPIEVVAYSPSWPETYEKIQSNLEIYLAAGGVTYKTIEHIGSTSIPGMPAKNNIDIIIVVSSAEEAQRAKHALTHEPPATEYYKCFGDGGIKGRISMKPQDGRVEPRQSVYIVRDDDEDPDGQLVIRSHRTLRDTLRMPDSKELKKAYAEVKVTMADEGIKDRIEYGQRKNGVIRQILKSAGWSDGEVDAKEALDYRVAQGSPSPDY